MNPYETDRLLSEYLLFHYGSAEEIVPPPLAAREALFFPSRCVTACVDASALPPGARALDLGCAVGRSTFELARICSSALGVDYSRRFIEAAEMLREGEALRYSRVEEGRLTTRLSARAPEGVDGSRIRFETGDAMALRNDLADFDAVLMANLIDRLREPRRCLARLPALVRPGGQLVITSPCTWLEEFTPREHWLGGESVTTHEELQRLLDGDFDLVATKDLPFLIREHARKFQLSVAQATIWRRR